MGRTGVKTSVELSIPKARTVRGYSIERMPIGRFLEAIQMIEDAPNDVLKKLFPDCGADGILTRFAALDREGLKSLFTRALTLLPGYAVRLFAGLSGIAEENLLNDPDVGLDGLCEMAEAWIEVNGIENFIKAAGALTDKVRGAARRTGSKS